MTEQQKERILRAKRALFDKYYSFLNPEQRRAVFTINGPVLILAGAGSGKTTVLVNRVSYLLKFGNAYFDSNIPEFFTEDAIEDLENAINSPRDIIEKYLELFINDVPNPWGVLAITFTNKAANEIKERLIKTIGNDAGSIWAGTFHAICMRILRVHYELVGYHVGFSVCDTDESKKVISKCLKDLKIDEKKLPIKYVMNEISRAKDKLMTPEDYKEYAQKDAKYVLVAQAYELYQKRLMDSNLLDFDDIIFKTVELLRENDDVREYYREKFKYISVDEYQDTNKAQFVLISLLTSSIDKNIMVVGDDDQSIYKFRGATIENILNFDQLYPEATVIKLEQNYRSTENILNAANSVIKNNSHKHIKNLWCKSELGDKIIVKETATQNDESKYIIDKIIAMRKEKGLEYKDFAILYRVNAQSMNLESFFAKSGIPYRMLGALRFYDRKEVKDMIAYLSVINNPLDAIHLSRIVNEPKRGIGDASFETATRIAEEINLPLLRVLETAYEYNAIPSRAQGAMVSFAKTMISLINDAEHMKLEELVVQAMERTGYRADLVAKGQTEEERLQNLDALCVAVREYEERADDPSLSGFLEEAALVSDIDKYDENADAVTLMTIHSSKGLEFPVVFLPGMEEGIFPGQQSIGSPTEIEEERRLAYVAITRAKKSLIITHTKERMLYGSTQRNPVSRFVKEIDKDCLDIQAERPVVMSAPQNRYNYSDSFKKPEPTKVVPFEIGDHVKHFTFGEGYVLKVTPMSGDYMYEIAFDNVGTKKLMATYVAKLMKKI